MLFVFGVVTLAHIIIVCTKLAISIRKTHGSDTREGTDQTFKDILQSLNDYMFSLKRQMLKRDLSLFIKHQVTAICQSLESVTYSNQLFLNVLLFE